MNFTEVINRPTQNPIVHRFRQQAWWLSTPVIHMMTIGWIVISSGLIIFTGLLDPRAINSLSVLIVIAVGGIDIVLILISGVALPVLAALIVYADRINGTIDLLRLTALSDWRIFDGYRQVINERLANLRMLLAGSVISLWTSVSVLGMWTLGRPLYSTGEALFRLLLIQLVLAIPAGGWYLVIRELTKLAETQGFATGLQADNREKVVFVTVSIIGLGMGGIVLTIAVSLLIPCCTFVIPFPLTYFIRHRYHAMSQNIRRTLLSPDNSSRHII